MRTVAMVCRHCHGEDEEEVMEATVSPLEPCWVCRRPVDPGADTREARPGMYFWVMRLDAGEILTNPFPRP